MCTDDPTVTFSHVELRVSKYSQLRVQARASLVCDESRAERRSAKGFCLLVMAAAVCRARLYVGAGKTKSKSHRSDRTDGLRIILQMHYSAIYH